MKLKYIDLATGYVIQNAREVITKFSKTFTSFFFPADDVIREIVPDCVSFLRDDKLWSNDDPPLPATQIKVGKSHQFKVTGFDRKHWSTATPIRSIFRNAFQQAGWPYFDPHSFRNTLIQLGKSLYSAGAIQGMEPEPWSWKGIDHLFQLWRGCLSAAEGNHLRTGNNIININSNRCRLVAVRPF